MRMNLSEIEKMRHCCLQMCFDAYFIYRVNFKTLIPSGFMALREWLPRAASACGYTLSVPLVALAGGISPLGR